jgi:hypothetical protein
MISLANGNFFESRKHLNNEPERASFIPWRNDRETPLILLIQEWQVTPVAALHYQAENKTNFRILIKRITKRHTYTIWTNRIVYATRFQWPEMGIQPPSLHKHGIQQRR